MAQKITADQLQPRPIGTERLIGTNGGYNVYEKFISGTVNMSGTGAQNIAHGITSLGTMINMTASVSLGADSSYQNLPYVESAQRVQLSYDNTNVIYNNSFAWGSARPYRIYMVYTRTA